MKVIEMYLVKYFENRGLIPLYLTENGWFLHGSNSVTLISDDEAEHAIDYTLNMKK